MSLLKVVFCFTVVPISFVLLFFHGYSDYWWFPYSIVFIIYLLFTSLRLIVVRHVLHLQEEFRIVCRVHVAKMGSIGRSERANGSDCIKHWHAIQRGTVRQVHWLAGVCSAGGLFGYDWLTGWRAATSQCCPSSQHELFAAIPSSFPPFLKSTAWRTLCLDLWFSFKGPCKVIAKLIPSFLYFTIEAVNTPKWFYSFYNRNIALLQSFGEERLFLFSFSFLLFFCERYRHLKRLWASLTLLTDSTSSSSPGASSIRTHQPDMRLRCAQVGVAPLVQGSTETNK